MFVLRVGVIAASCALAGCHSTPVAVEDRIQAPAERLLAFQNPNIPSVSTIVVTRDDAFQGGGCFAAFSVNGQLAARLDIKETARFWVSPGEVLLKTSPDPQGKGLCSMGADTHFTQRETILKPGETKHFRMTISPNGAIDIQRSD